MFKYSTFDEKLYIKLFGGEKNRRIIDLQDSRVQVAGREGGVKRRKRILLEQPKVLRVFFFKKKRNKAMHAWVQKGKEMLRGMHACMHYICFVCLALATRPAAFNLLASNAHYQQFPAMGKRHERDLRVIKKTKREISCGCIYLPEDTHTGIVFASH